MPHLIRSCQSIIALIYRIEQKKFNALDLSNFAIYFVSIINILAVFNIFNYLVNNNY